MSETTFAYLLGPIVIAIVGLALWIAPHYHTHYHRKPGPTRNDRWLDTHYVDLMHHRH